MKLFFSILNNFPKSQSNFIFSDAPFIIILFANTNGTFLYHFRISKAR